MSNALSGRGRARRQKENEVTRDCFNWLVKRGWRPHRNHCGVFFTPHGGRINGEKPGTPDWSFSKPTERGNARFIYVEMKSSVGRLSKAQHETIAILKHYGYTVIVADSLESLKEQLGSVYADSRIDD
jgi:hypothetical protein